MDSLATFYKKAEKGHKKGLLKNTKIFLIDKKQRQDVHERYKNQRLVKYTKKIYKMWKYRNTSQ